MIILICPEQEKIKDNISYDNLIEKVDPKFVNNIMDIMVDNIYTKGVHNDQ